MSLFRFAVPRSPIFLLHTYLVGRGTLPTSILQVPLVNSARLYIRGMFCSLYAERQCIYPMPDHFKGRQIRKSIRKSIRSNISALMILNVCELICCCRRWYQTFAVARFLFTSQLQLPIRPSNAVLSVPHAVPRLSPYNLSAICARR